MAKDVKFLDKSRQTEQPRDAYKWIGKDMKRVEDPRLLAGKGIYIDDVQLPKMAHAAVLRSPHAHARIMSIDTSKAKNSPGVILVMTGAEAAEVTGPTASFASPPCPQYCLAVDRVRHVGETRLSATLVRGTDNYGHFDLEPELKSSESLTAVEIHADSIGRFHKASESIPEMGLVH